MGNPSADRTNPQYVVTLTNIEDGVAVGINTSSRTNLRRLPRGAGVERKAVTQQDWSGGRGIDRASEDATRYGDGMNVFTHVSGQVTNGPLACLTKIRDGIFNYWKPSEFLWSPDPSNNTGISYDDNTTITVPTGDMARSFVPASGFTVTRLAVLTRKIQRGGSNITVAIYDNSGGSPGTALWSDSVIALYDLDDMAAKAMIFKPDLPLTGGVTYWLVVTTDSSCHTAIGLDHSATNIGKTKATDALVWSNSTVAPIFYLTAADSDFETIHFFEYKRALYAVPQLASGAAGSLWINGDRGVATNGSSPVTNSTTIVADNTKGWTTNEWAGCMVYITNGTNKGLSREIQSNTDKTLTLTEALPVACATGASGSEYVILGSDKWTVCTATSGGAGITLAASCKSIAVLNNIVYFATGTGTTIRRMREYNNAGVWTREYADDVTDGADLLMSGAHWQTAEQAIYRAKNTDSTVSVAKKSAWGANLTFEAAIECGNAESIINGMCRYNQAGGYYAYVGKEDGIYALRDGKFAEIEIGMQWSRDERNGKAIAGWMTNLYFSFLDGFERLYGQVVDDIGPNRDQGLESERRGRVADIRTVMNQLYAAYDAGDKYYPTTDAYSGTSEKRYSAIFSTTSPGGDWHEIFRGWEAGERITSLFYQPIPGKSNRLWFRYGADIGYLIMPDTINPLNDPNQRYAPEAHVITGWFDMGTPEYDHYIDQLRVTVMNTINSQRRVRVYYQIVPELAAVTSIYPGASLWHQVEDVGGGGLDRFLLSPIGDGALTGSKVRFRISMSSDTLTSCVLKSYELRADTMNEVLYDYQFDFTLKDNEMLLNGDDTTLRAADIYTILEQWKEDATPLRMRVALPGGGTVFDHILGHIDPLSLVTLEWNDEESEVAGNISFKQTAQYAGQL